MQRFWTITVWDSTQRLFERTIPASYIGDSQLEALIRTLVAKHGLTDDETVSCYLSSRAPATRTHLDIRREHGSIHALHCGDNPYVTAIITDSSGKPLKRDES